MRLRALQIILILGLMGCLIGACTVIMIASPSTLLPGRERSASEATQIQPTSVEALEIRSAATEAASPTPIPPVTPTPAPTPAPQLVQLSQGRCCVQPFFSPNGQYVFFIDKPTADAIAGIYGIDLNKPLSEPSLIYGTIGFRNADWSIVATMEGEVARFVNESSGANWIVDTGGNWPHYSPDGSQILWAATDREGPYDRRQTDIWLANLDGSKPRLVVSLLGGNFAGWLPDSQRMALLTRDNPAGEERTLFIYDAVNEQRVDLVREKRIRGIEISPGGGWIAYFIAFTDNPEGNGLWIASSDGAIRRRLNVPAFGAYHWRDDNTLLYIPMRATAAESMQLWEIDVSANTGRPLTEGDSIYFSISNGDWEVSPDGRQVIFVNSADQNIWLIRLP